VRSGEERRGEVREEEEMWEEEMDFNVNKEIMKELERMERKEGRIGWRVK
jgi:hypothetical protein